MVTVFGVRCFATATVLVCGTVCRCSFENRTFCSTVVKLYWRCFCFKWRCLLTYLLYLMLLLQGRVIRDTRMYMIYPASSDIYIYIYIYIVCNCTPIMHVYAVNKSYQPINQSIVIYVHYALNSELTICSQYRSAISLTHSNIYIIFITWELYLKTAYTWIKSCLLGTQVFVTWECDVVLGENDGANSTLESSGVLGSVDAQDDESAILR